MSEERRLQSGEAELVCRVRKRTQKGEATGAKVFHELERLGVSVEILESLKSAQTGGNKTK